MGKQRFLAGPVGGKRAKRMKHKSLLIGIISGVLYGLVLRLLIDLNLKDFLRTMTFAYLFATPAIIGGLTVYFGTEEQRKSWPFRVMMPWTSIGAFLLLTLIAELEASVCVFLLLPAFMISASIGGLLTGFMMDKVKRPSGTLSIFLLFPFAIGPIENQFDNPIETHRVETEIVINADKQTVWQHIKSVDTIDDKELKWSYAHFIGMPKPINSKLLEEKVGGIRKINWDKGIKFREVITDWEPLDHFSYDIIIDTIPPDAIDPHIEVGGAYFSVLTGGYQLDKIDDQTTALTLYCDYRIASKFNFYSNFWADFILDDFQVVILNVIKDRSEKSENSEPLKDKPKKSPTGR